jgi:hypothetical protein
MRIVRFYLEPWQKGGTPSPSQSLYNLSPHIRRRQRLVITSPVEQINRKPMDKQGKSWKNRQKHRYPPVVKKLSALCSDVLVENVIQLLITPF